MYSAGVFLIRLVLGIIIFILAIIGSVSLQLAIEKGDVYDLAASITVYLVALGLLGVCFIL